MIRYLIIFFCVWLVSSYSLTTLDVKADTADNVGLMLAVFFVWVEVRWQRALRNFRGN